MKRKILKVFFVCICYTVFFYSNTAFCIDWEQWRIPDNSSIPDAPAPVPAYPSYGIERPTPRQERKDTRKREAFELNKKGNQAYKARKWKEAVRYFNEALSKSPNDSVIKQNLSNAESALKSENDRDREEYLLLRRAFDLNAKGIQAYRLGSWKKAARYFSAALSKSPNDSVIKQNLSNARSKLKNEKIKLEREKIKLEKETNRVKLELENTRREENMRKKEASILNKKGNQAYKMSNWKEAIIFYDKALSKSPNDSVIKQNLSNAKRALKTESDFKKKKNEILAHLKGGSNSGKLSPKDGRSSLKPIEDADLVVVESSPAGGVSEINDRISSLSDVQLNQEIEVVTRTLKRIGKDSERNIKELNEWAQVSRDAQVGALKSSVDLFLDTATRKLEKVKSADYTKFTETANDIRRKIEDLEDFGEKLSRQEEKKLYEVIEKLVRDSEVIAEANNIPVVRLASFSVDYAYNASRWWVARNQIHSIADNLDKRGGVLSAQKILIERHKQLIRERTRRKVISGGSVILAPKIFKELEGDKQ